MMSSASNTTMRQMLLPLSLPIDFTIGSFQVSRSNEQAVQTVMAGLQATYGLPLMMVYGEAGCGKSHFGRAITQQLAAQAYMLPAAELLSGAASATFNLGQNPPALLVLDTLEDILDQHELQMYITELINQRRQDGLGKILFLSRLSPTDWSRTEAFPDFVSRLKGCGYGAEIFAADDALLRAVLCKQAADRQFTLPERVLDYCLSRMPRRFSAVQQLVHDLDTLSLERQGKITLATARAALDRLTDAEDGSVC